MQSTLDSLQNSASLLANVEARLTAARKAGAPSDPDEGLQPAATLASRASDLGALLDGMGHAVEALRTASQGVAAIQVQLGAMSAVAEAVAQGTQPAEALAPDYDAHLARIDQIADATRYNGTRLIDGSDPGLLTTLFNGTSASATPRSLPELSLTASNLGLAPAGDSWGDETSLATTRLQLAQATASLAEAAASLTLALATVQTRRDFTSQLIATLTSVTDAEPARPAAPTPSLSLATQANQAVMRLFP